ncbi:AraC family transcriptional regulator [Paenibacillus pasadenensis]|uniref:AraC family transcriptional regulator n=1 Tax=Paenibacillus pasadenensis TaxID=217090 RepID=UPI00203FCC10|nr:AraC family transcriptional regulator [Paenibacillus pasadenensis]MCM3746594.1 AraC family transcriptional regulator [Paenibacillus pasadenensis]
MSVHELIAAWNELQIKVIDVRRRLLPADGLRVLQPLPAHAFVIELSNGAAAGFKETGAASSRYTVLHGSKGTMLDMHQPQERLYAIYYKADRSSAATEKQEQLSWFNEPRRIHIHHPVKLLQLTELLLEQWESQGPLEMKQFRTRMLLQQWVYELIQQAGLDSDDRQLLAERIAEFLRMRYMEPITLESIAGAFNYSIPYITKHFKQVMGKSPIDFLIGIRMNKAKELLLSTDASVQAVAEGVGYSDSAYFAKTFKKHFGQTPAQFKERPVFLHQEEADRPINWLISSLVSKSLPAYNFIENDYQYIEGGKGEDSTMFRYETKGKLAMIMLGLAMLLSACSGAANTANTTNNAATNSASAAQNIASAAPQAEQGGQKGWPRTYTDALGREVVIQQKPEKIIVTHFAMMEYFFALDRPPIASTLAERILSSFETLKPYESSGVTDIGQVATPDLELMMKLEPDLIVGLSGVHNDVYEDLSKIAPVVMVDTSDLGWKEMLREYAGLAGEEEKAETFITELEALMDEARGKLAAYKDKSVTFLRPTGDGQTFYVLDESSVEYAYGEEGLGFKLPAAQKMEDGIISMEGVVQMNPEMIFIVDYLDSMDAINSELSKSKVWNSLQAVKDGNVYSLDVSIDAGGPLAIRHVIEQMLVHLAE